MTRWLLALVLAVTCTVPVARALEMPEGRVVLTVSGNIDVTNDGDVARFDIDMLRALDWREITTFTAFTNGPQQFAGPTLSSLLDALGVEEGTLRARAVNDYSVEIPVAHAAAHDVLIAAEHGGKPMRVRDKGPLWIVYPQSEAKAQDNTFNTEMIWQLTEIEVLP